MADIDRLVKARPQVGEAFLAIQAAVEENDKTVQLLDPQIMNESLGQLASQGLVPDGSLLEEPYDYRISQNLPHPDKNRAWQWVSIPRIGDGALSLLKAEDIGLPANGEAPIRSRGLFAALVDLEGSDRSLFQFRIGSSEQEDVSVESIDNNKTGLHKRLTDDARLILALERFR